MKCLFAMSLLTVVGIVSWAAGAEQADRPIELLVRGDDMGHSLDINLGFINRLLYTHDAQDIDGRYSGAKYFPANLEAWGTVKLPDGKLAYWCGPDLPEATRLKFLDSLRKLQPGTWYTVCHPGFYAPRQAQSVAALCSQDVKDIVRERGIRLISYADLWNRRFGGKDQ